MLTLDWLPTRVSDTGGPSKGYLFLVAHTKGIWYWWPVNCHLLLVAHTRAIGGPGIFLRFHALTMQRAPHACMPVDAHMFHALLYAHARC